MIHEHRTRTDPQRLPHRACPGRGRGGRSRPDTRQSCQLVQTSLRLLQPEPHVHLAVHRRRRAEMLLRLLALVRVRVELAEAEVTVGDEGAHAELLGERERVTEVAVSVLRGIAAGGDLTEEPEGPRFVTALTAFAGKAQG